MIQRVIPILSENFISNDVLEKEPDWTAVFGNDNPIALEIGCGTGHFVEQRATAQPETNFLAIDIYNKGCLKTCAKIDSADLKNVRVMRIEARWLLAKGFTEESLSAVYINCPDPWPKKRHRSRRLVNRDFLITLAGYLKPEADFFFSTDFADYAEDVSGQIKSLNGYRNELPTDWAYTLKDYPISKYMQRFLDRGQNIYYIHYKRDQCVPIEELPVPQIRRGYRTAWQKAENV